MGPKLTVQCRIHPKCVSFQWSYKIIICSKHLKTQISNMILWNVISLLLIKEVHLHEDAIKCQEHHSTDSFRNLATQSTTLKQHLFKCWAVLEFKKGKIPKWDGNNGKSISIKSELSWALRENWNLCQYRRDKRLNIHVVGGQDNWSAEKG